MTNELLILSCGHSQASGIIITLIPAIILAFWNFSLNKKIETLKSEGQKQIHVHKTQFDKEFIIYENVWQKIIDMRNAVYPLRPQFGFGEVGKPYEEQMNENVKKAIAVGNELILLTEKNKPFYDQQVYEELSEVIKLIKAEVIEVQYGDRTKGQYWTEGKQTMDKLIASSDRICEKIRQRIQNINKDTSN
jgi:hypothetical protein